MKHSYRCQLVKNCHGSEMIESSSCCALSDLLLHVHLAQSEPFHYTDIHAHDIFCCRVVCAASGGEWCERGE